MIQDQNNNTKLVSKREMQMQQKQNIIRRMQEQKDAECNYNAIKWNTKTS